MIAFHMLGPTDLRAVLDGNINVLTEAERVESRRVELMNVGPRW